MYDFQVLLEKCDHLGSPACRVVIYDYDKEDNAKSVHDIIVSNVESINDARRLSDIVLSSIYDNDFTILYAEDYDFGKARTMAGKLSKAIFQMMK